MGDTRPESEKKVKIFFIYIFENEQSRNAERVQKLKMTRS